MSWIELVAQSRPAPVPKGVTPPDNAADWYRIENNAETPDETDVYVYDAIGGWFGTTADEFIRDLKGISTGKINLRLNSPGGSVFEGITIANTIRSHPSSITVYVDGLAASIASVIALAGDRLVMMPNSQMMIHDASGSAYGNAADMEYMVGLLNKQSDNIADAYADRAGGTAAEWRDLMKAETWYTAKEAVAAGLADEVMPVPERETEEAPDTRLKTLWDLSAYRYAGRTEAPAPPVKAQTAQLHMRVDTSTIAAQVTEAIRNAIRPRPADPVAEGEGVLLEGVPDASLLDAVREVIRAELAEFKAALPPFLRPDEDEEEEEETEDSSTEEVEDESVEDESAKPSASLPPETTPESPVAPEPAVAPSAAESVEPVDEWQSLVARLTVSPSPSADDVFNRLKEAL